jgi:multicomponent Na+:H+ antiporter subunit B
MIGAYPTVVVRVIAALLSPFIAMFGLYIIAHGHYGPGGGFAGGVFLAVGAILPRLTLPEHVAYRLVPTTVGPIAGRHRHARLPRDRPRTARARW